MVQSVRSRSTYVPLKDGKLEDWVIIGAACEAKWFL